MSGGFVISFYFLTTFSVCKQAYRSLKEKQCFHDAKNIVFGFANVFT